VCRFVADFVIVVEGKFVLGASKWVFVVFVVQRDSADNFGRVVGVALACRRVWVAWAYRAWVGVACKRALVEVASFVVEVACILAS
jgi:hypothetical protein